MRSDKTCVSVMWCLASGWNESATCNAESTVLTIHWNTLVLVMHTIRCNKYSILYIWAILVIYVYSYICNIGAL